MPPPLPATPPALPHLAAASTSLGYANHDVAPRYAGFGRRLLAWIIDSLATNVALVLALLLIGAVAQVVQGGDRLGRHDAPPSPAERGTFEYVAIAMFVGVPLIVG